MTMSSPLPPFAHRTQAKAGLPFPLPPLPSTGEVPVWDGRHFCLASGKTQILEYGYRLDGWSDALSAFHEDHAGTDHFIDVASRDYAAYQVRKALTTEAPVVLEVGTSSGFMLNHLV